jgi:hypothetical protein
MPRSCTVCGHPKRKAIDEALFRNGTSFRNIAEHFSATVSSLHRHKQHVTVAEQQVRKFVEPMENLPPKKRAYIEGRLGGASRRQAALGAGYSESMANNPTQKIETADVREAFATLIRETIPAEKIAKTIAAGIEANETKFFSHEGKVEDQRDVIAWSERRQYAALAAEYGGYHKPAAKDEGAQGGGVIIVLPRSTADPKSVEAGPVIEGEVSSGPIVTLPGEE